MDIMGYIYYYGNSYAKVFLTGGYHQDIMDNSWIIIDKSYRSTDLGDHVFFPSILELTNYGGVYPILTF